MHRPVRLGRPLAALLVAVAAVTACQPTAESLPRLTDPNEVLEEAIRTTAELDFVQLAADVEVSLPGGGGTAGVVGTVELDLRSRDFHGVMETSGIGFTERQEFLLIGQDAYTKSATDPKWFHSQVPPASDPRAQIPATPAIAVALEGLLDEDGISSTLEGVEACPTGQCYHIVTSLAPAFVWAALQGLLMGARIDDIAPADPGIPEVALDILVDEATRRLVSVSGAGTYEDASLEATVTLSGHDVEFQLRRPAPNQVEDTSGGFSEEAVPAPVPAP